MCSCFGRVPTRFGLPHPRLTHRCLVGEPISRKKWVASLGALTSLVAAAPRVALATIGGGVIAYDFVSSKTVRGSQITSVLPDGTIDVRYAYMDRGHGPDLHSRISVGSDGFITSLQTTGVNYSKHSVDETFVDTPSGVHWKNAIENEQHSSERRLYVSFAGTPEESAIVVRAILQAQKALPLWPAGEASAVARETLTLHNGTQRRSVTMFEVSGFSFVPDYVWLDAKDHSLFMLGSEWGAVIVRGWKDALPQLFAAQHDRDTKRGREEARAFAQTSPAALAVSDVALFDPATATLLPGRTVLMQGDHVVALGDASLTVPSDARRIDGAGKTLMPGMWDMHQHFDASFGMRVLAQGVTTIRDPGNTPGVIDSWQQQFNSGELLGPRIIIAGLIDGKGPYTLPTGQSVDNEQETLECVRDWKRRGAVQIKMYSSLKTELVPVIAKEAHAQGMRVSGHIPSGMYADEAIAAGYDEIQHVNFLFLNCMRDVKDTRGLARLTEPLERAGTIDLNGPQMTALLDLMKSRDIVSDPTLTIFYDAAFAEPGNAASSGYADILDWLPPQIRRELLAPGFMPPGSDKAAYHASALAMQRLVKLLHDTGIRVVAGTDDVNPGFDLIRELELYSRAGIPNAEVLQIATLHGPAVMKMTDRFGSLEPGKVADAILIHGDPVTDITALRRVGTTIKGGVPYDARALYAAQGVRAPALA